MLQTYYIGDQIGYAPRGLTPLYATFLGARRSDAGWTVTLLYATEQCCARQEYDLAAGQLLRFTPDWIMRVDKNDAGKKTDRRGCELRISSIEPDAITAEIYVKER